MQSGASSSKSMSLEESLKQINQRKQNTDVIRSAEEMVMSRTDWFTYLKSLF